MKGFKRWLSSAVSYLRDGTLYVEHRLRGTPYGSYYARRMDYIVRRNPNWGLNLNKRFQLDYLISHGLTPESTLLDFGCGALAAGIQFIEYLDARKYIGIDVSHEAVMEGRRRLAAKSLIDTKQPEVSVIEPGTLDVLGDRTFDFIWAQSVFTHMPPDDVRVLLLGIGRHMHVGSRFFASFAHTDNDPHQRRFKDWYYNADFFQCAAEVSNLQAKIMTDWRHPNDPAGRDTLVQFTLNHAREEVVA